MSQFLTLCHSNSLTNQTGVGTYMTDGDLISIYKNNTNTNEKELLTFDAVIKIDLNQYENMPTVVSIEVQ